MSIAEDRAEYSTARTFVSNWLFYSSKRTSTGAPWSLEQIHDVACMLNDYKAGRSPALDSLPAPTTGGA